MYVDGKKCVRTRVSPYIYGMCFSRVDPVVKRDAVRGNKETRSRVHASKWGIEGRVVQEHRWASRCDSLAHWRCRREGRSQQTRDVRRAIMATRLMMSTTFDSTVYTVDHGCC